MTCQTDLDQASDPHPAGGGPTCRMLFTGEQAADYAGVQLEVIVHGTRIGRLRVYLADDGRARFDQVELDRCIASLKWLPAEPKK